MGIFALQGGEDVKGLRILHLSSGGLFTQEIGWLWYKWIHALSLCLAPLSERRKMRKIDDLLTEVMRLCFTSACKLVFN